MENTEETRYEGLKNFFKLDSRLKQEMMEYAPNGIMTEEEKINYTDSVEEMLKDTKNEIKAVFRKLNINIDEQIDEFFQQKMIELANCLNKPNGINEFYQNSISNLDSEFVENVKKTCVGYAMTANYANNLIIPKAKSLNELLHYLHSSIVNNDELLQSMPVIEKKKYITPRAIEIAQKRGIEINDSWANEVTLYGDENQIARELFDKFPNDSQSPLCDIISLENKILIMARDLGHALTIDIDTSEEKPLVKYFIPKICNRKMIEALPGIGKITQSGASGMFEVENVSELSQKIFSFMEKVPTDSDMVMENDIVFEQEEKIEKEEKNEENHMQYGVQFDRESVQELVSTRKISNIKNIVESLKKKIRSKDTIEKDRE